MSTTSIVAGCLNTIACVPRISLTLMIPCILLVVVWYWHILISILSTKGSWSPVANTISFIHHVVHVFALLGCLNTGNFARRYRQVTLSMDLHWIRDFWITSDTLIDLLKVVVNVDLWAATLIFNMLVKFHHLRLFLVEFINNFLSYLISQEFIVLEVSIHIFQFLLDQLIFHNITNLILMYYLTVLLYMTSWKSLTYIDIAKCSTYILLMRGSLTQWWLVLHRAHSIQLPVTVMSEILLESLVMLLYWEPTSSWIQLFEMLGWWRKCILYTLFTFMIRIETDIRWN